MPFQDTIASNIAIVIPAYCAEPYIEQVIKGIPLFVRLMVVVDDCSTDHTALVVSRLAESDKRIHLICHQKNLGVGGAVLSGYHLACQLGAEVIVKMDSDGQMDPQYLPDLIAPIFSGKADYVKGNRFLHSRQLKTMPLGRRLGNTGLSLLTKLASGYWNIFDPTNGYTAIHASLVPLLNQGAIHLRYFFETSMFLELGLLRAVIKDVYIPARYGSQKSYLSEKKMLFLFPPLLLKGFLRRVWVQYLVRDFGIVSVFLMGGTVLFAFGMLYGGYHWIRSLQLNTATPTGTIMLAVLPVILGIQLLLQAVVLDVQGIPSEPVRCEIENVRILAETLRH